MHILSIIDNNEFIVLSASHLQNPHNTHTSTMALRQFVSEQQQKSQHNKVATIRAGTTC